MATAAVPDGVVVEVPVAATDHSPSQERLTRIAAMLREAEQATAPTGGRNPRQNRPRRERRVRSAA